MSYLKALIMAAVVALSIIFMIQNIGPLSQPLSIRLSLMYFKFESTSYPVYLIIMLAFFVGLLSASLMGLVERFRMRRLLAAKNKELKTLNSELDSLRNLPLTDESLPASEPFEAVDPFARHEEVNGLEGQSEQEKTE